MADLVVFRYCIEVSDNKYVRKMPGNGFSITENLVPWFVLDDETAIEIAKIYDARKVTRRKFLNMKPNHVEETIIWEDNNYQ